MYRSTTDAIADCYEAHAAELRRFATTKTRDETAAEDVVQEAFLRLAIELRADRFPDQPRAWLYRVTANLIVSQARRASVAARNAQRPDWIVTETPETRFLVLEEGRRLDVALRRTSRRARRGLLMAAEGYSGREIAAAIQTNEGATRALMARARKLIRRELGDAPATAA